MTRVFIWRAARLLSASLVIAAALAWGAPHAFARGAPQGPAQQPSVTSAPAPQAEASAPADEPLYTEFKGLKLGASQSEARKLLGPPQEKDKTQDFFVFSDRERARVYYDDKGSVSAIIVTYIGKSSDAPTPKAVLGTDVEAKQDGSMYKMVNYPKAGYWVAYSRTAGDEPLTIIVSRNGWARSRQGHALDLTGLNAVHLQPAGAQGLGDRVGDLGRRPVLGGESDENSGHACTIAAHPRPDIRAKS